MKILKKFFSKVLKKKRIPINKRIAEIFNEEKYLQANPDVRNAIERGEHSNALEHFIVCGYEEIRQGLRQKEENVPYFDEDIYLKYNHDIYSEKIRNKNFDVYEHFLCYGIEEYKSGRRQIIGLYPVVDKEGLLKKFKEKFDENEYLKASKDINEKISEGLFENAYKHFSLHGFDEIRKGKRQIHPKIPKISEIDYLLMFPDVRESIDKGEVSTPFEHFLLHGYQEFIDGSRSLPTYSKFISKDILDSIVDKTSYFNIQPKISIVMPVYNVDVQWLQAAIQSVEKQWYEKWELCIVDDASTREETVKYLSEIKNPKIKVKFLNKNEGISGASNVALRMAEGEYVALMDHDDELTEDALFWVVKAINDEKAEFIYSDEDKLEIDGRLSEPHYKPDYAPDMILSQNYISHFTVILKSLIEDVGGWEKGLEGSQDYDLYLKVLEKTDKVFHIPKVLYHWRKIPGSTASEFSEKDYAQEAGRKAIQNAMQRRGVDATVKNGKFPGTYRVRYALKEKPLVSIVVPFKDKPELLKMSIESILRKSTYQNFEIIGISNNSVEKETFLEIDRLSRLDHRIKFYEYNIPFNYSRINNYAVMKYAKGKHIVLMNNDIEIITPDWIEEMLGHSQREEVGAVGAKLYYPQDDTLQHAGVILGLGGVAGHSHKYFSKKDPGYFYRPHITQNLSAVTAALLMVKRRIYEDVKGLDEDNLKVAFNDVDFCLKIREKGYLNVYTPWVEAYHHESKSRGIEDTPEKQKRFQSEVAYMRKKWSEQLDFDPFYNPNLTKNSEDFSLM